MAIELISKIKPKNNGDFPLVDAEDVAYKDGRLHNYMPEFLTYKRYIELQDAGKINATTPYFIVRDYEGDNE